MLDEMECRSAVASGAGDMFSEDFMDQIILRCRNVADDWPLLVVDYVMGDS